MNDKKKIRLFEQYMVDLFYHLHLDLEVLHLDLLVYIRLPVSISENLLMSHLDVPLFISKRWKVFPYTSFEGLPGD